MIQKDLINDHLKTFGAKVKVDDLALDEENFCGIVFGKKGEEIQINIEVIEEEDMVCFHTTLLELPKENREEIYRQLLSAHLFGLETNGAFFGVNPETDDVLLCYTWVLEQMEYQDFEAMLENLFAATKYWISELKGGGEETKLSPVQRPSGIIRV
ncbi:MAG: type III secretion system chaperone [bacterium]